MDGRAVQQCYEKTSMLETRVPVSCHECCLQCEGMVPDETTPLIEHRMSSIGYLFMFFLFLFLCVGTAVGAYLLIEDAEGDHPKPFPLIVESKAKRYANVSLRYALPPKKVQLTEITGPPDDGLRNSYSNYNFVLDADGTVYEALGWDFRSKDCDNETLSIAFLGDGAEMVPSPEQMHETGRLFQWGIFEKNLSPCHWIVVQSDRNVRLVEEVTKLLNKIRIQQRC